MDEQTKSKIESRFDTPIQKYLSRFEPKNSLMVMGCFAGFFGLATIQFVPMEYFPFWLIIFFFVMMIWLRSAWALSCVFIVLLTLKFFNSADNLGLPRGYFESSQLEAVDLVFVLCSLLFLGSSLRFLEIHKYNLAYFSEFGIAKESYIDSKRHYPTFLGGKWWVILLAIVAAFFLLQVYPLDRMSVKKYWIRPKAMRLIFLIGTMILAWYVSRGVFSLIARWRMDVDQAGVHVRSIYANEYWAEHRGIESRLEKINRKRQAEG